MYQSRLWAAAVLVAVTTSLAGCGQVSSAGTAAKNEPAKVETIPGSDISRLRLSPKAAERLGIQTAPVRAASGAAKLAMPYSALLYDANGGTWAYTSPENLVFVRHRVTVARIDGDTVFLTDGPPAGSTVVTVGVPELFGTEFKVGK